MLINPYLGQLILLVTFLNVDSLECNSYPIEPNEFYFSNHSKHFMVESDSDNPDSINVFDYPLTQQLKKVSYDKNAEIIQTIIIDSWSKEVILEKQLCYLFKQEGYYISCIVIEGLFQVEGESQTQNDSQFYSFTEHFKLPVLTQLDESCDFLFQNSSLGLSIFCTSLNSLNIYFINQTSLTFTKQDYKIQLAQENCKTKYISIFQNQFLLIFYDCLTWAIYILKNNLLNLILNREMEIQKDPSFNLSVLENFQICQDNLILIGDHKYYHYQYVSDDRLNLNFVMEVPFLKQVVFDSECQLKYYLGGSELINKFYIRNNQLNYELERIPKYIYFVSDLFFVIYEDELEVMLTDKFKQKIQLKPFPLHFQKINNIFYHIDSESKFFTFFKYKILNNPIIRPKKQFLLIYPYNLHFVGDSPDFCIQFQEKPLNYINNYTLPIDSECDISSTMLIEKTFPQIPYNYKFQIVQDQLNIINFITDQQQFEHFCPIPKNLLKNSRFLYFHNFGRTYSIFQTSKVLNILFCDNQQQIQINIKNQKVLNHDDHFMLINLQGNHFRLLKIYHDVQMQKKFTLDEIIQVVLHYSNYVLLITTAQSLVLFDLNAERYIQLPSILNDILLTIYLQNINNNDEVKNFFMNIYRNSYFIQYYEHFIIFDNNQLNHFKIKQLQVLQIRKIISLKDSYYMVAVDLTQNALLQYYFDLIELTLLDEYFFFNFKLIKPIVYQETYEFITISSIMNNNIFLHIFQILRTYPFKLKQTIQTSSNNNFVSFRKLYYFDQNNVIQVLDLKYLFLQFNALLTKQENLNFKQSVIFYITPESNNDTIIQISLNLSIFIHCAKLIPLFREVPIMLEEDNQKMLNLSDLYEGPIDMLKIQDNSNVLLEGPFLQSLWQDEIQNLTYTIKQFQIKMILTTFQQFSNHRLILKMQVFDEFDKYQQASGVIQSAFYVNKNQILLVYIHESKTKASIYRTDQENLTLRQDSNEISIEQLFATKDLIKIENLFSDGSKILFYVHNNSIFELKDNNKLENLIFIQNSNDLYLSLTKSNYPFLRIQTFGIESMELKTLNEFRIDFDKIQENFAQHTSKENNNLYSFLHIYPIKATASNQTLNILCLMILSNFSILQEIRVDLVSDHLNMTFLNILRNPQQQDDSTLNYINENFIILKQRNNCFFYDIRVQKQIYDYTFNFKCYQESIWQYNTTHYIFYSFMYENFTFGQIAYRLSILDDKKLGQTCTLMAENAISKAEITLKINKASNRNQISIEKFTYFALVFLILTVIVLVIYSIRRCLLKQQLTQPRRVLLVFGQ